MVADPYHTVKLVPPAYASPGLVDLIGAVQEWLQYSVDLLGNGDPEDAPDFTKELEDKGLATESAGKARMADDYATKKGQLETIKTDLHGKDQGVRHSTYTAGSLGNDTWTVIGGRITKLQGILSNPHPPYPPKDQKYLSAAAEAPLQDALLDTVSKVSGDLDDAWTKMKAYAQAVADANPDVPGGGTGTGSPAGTASPSGTTSIPNGGGPVSAEEISSGQKVTAKAIYDYLIQHYHLTPAQAAGIIGNMQVESSFNTGAWNPNEGALGLCQWEGGRLTALKAYAKAHGAAITDWKTQVDFMMSEMHGGESQAWSALQSAGTPAAAAAAFDQYYERSSGAARNQRMANATNLASQLAGVAA